MGETERMGKAEIAFMKFPGPNMVSVTGIPIPKRIFPELAEGVCSDYLAPDEEAMRDSSKVIESEIMRIGRGALREAGFSEDVLEKVEIKWEGMDRS